MQDGRAHTLLDIANAYEFSVFSTVWVANMYAFERFRPRTTSAQIVAAFSEKSPDDSIDLQRRWSTLTTTGFNVKSIVATGHGRFLTEIGLTGFLGLVLSEYGFTCPTDIR
jgi:hypothetical protein